MVLVTEPEPTSEPTNKKLEFLKPKWQSVILEKHLLIVNNTVEKIEREFLRKEEEVRKYNQK
jgi:hypothetical protein